uniref:Acyltransferase n=1 Tax=Bos mutus grunniens TaxID=30521 RepID=A0A8B9WXF8_BOSMU
MPCFKQPKHFQSLVLLHWPLSYLGMFWILQPLAIYLLFTSWWQLPALYFVWFLLDWKTPEQGGRRSAWVRNWCVWTHIRDYFPISVTITRAQLSHGSSPHGLWPRAFCNFCITPHLATLSWFFKIPLLGTTSCQPAIDYLLSHGTGNLVGIVVGGVGEALQSVPNTTMLILQKRKGFVRMALQHGAHLVPTYTFGETEVYDQVLFHKDSRMYKFQSYFRQILGFYFCIFYGRGFRQGSTGLLPYPLPIVTVGDGEPLPLPKIEKPSQEMVDKYHALYKKALTKLFDQHKTQYGCPETQKLLFL